MEDIRSEQDCGQAFQAPEASILEPNRFDGAAMPNSPEEQLADEHQSWLRKMGGVIIRAAEWRQEHIVGPEIRFFDRLDARLDARTDRMEAKEKELDVVIFGRYKKMVSDSIRTPRPVIETRYVQYGQRQQTRQRAADDFSHQPGLTNSLKAYYNSWRASWAGFRRDQLARRLGGYK